MHRCPHNKHRLGKWQTCRTRNKDLNRSVSHKNARGNPISIRLVPQTIRGNPISIEAMLCLRSLAFAYLLVVKNWNPRRRTLRVVNYKDRKTRTLMLGHLGSDNGSFIPVAG